MAFDLLIISLITAGMFSEEIVDIVKSFKRHDD